MHVQYAGQGNAPDGTTVTVPPPQILTLQGPRIQVNVSLAQTVAQQLVQQGISIAPPMSGMALIDTGASSTCVDAQAAQQLQLPVIDVVQLASASHAATQCNVYPVHIEMIGFPIQIDAPRVIGAELAAQGLLMLIGRDVLQHCTLHYNGFTGQITLAL
jgi:predicted aspartyl protease